MCSEVVELTKKMVAIASVNPQESTVLAEPYGEQAMAEFVFDWFKKAGLEVELQQVSPGRANVLATAKGPADSGTLLLCSHMDTVDVKGMTVEPFAGKVEQDCIYGRGACDDKGPLAAMMIAFRDRVKSTDKLPCGLAMLATCGEEYDLNGSKYFVEMGGEKPQAIVIGEPTELNVVVAHKGVVRLRLVVRGQGAHSATPELGKNAIYVMAKAVTVIEEFAEQLQKQTHHERLGCETIAVTIVNGGQQINIIPDYCESWIDWRILPGRDPRQCCDELAKVLADKVGEALELKLVSVYEAMETDESSAVVGSLMLAASGVTDSCELMAVSYATDASAWSGLGVDTAIFGPGSIRQAHRPDEFISIDQLEKGLAMYRIFLRDYGVCISEDASVKSI